MKKEKISKALNGIDEVYVEKAANYKKKRALMPAVKWGALAASLAFVIAGTALIMPMLDNTSVPPIIGEETTQVTTQAQESAKETAILHTTTTTYWNASTAATGEAIWGTQYIARISEGAYKNYAPMVALQPYEAPIGDKLTDVTVLGFWSSNDKDFFDAEDYTGEEEIEYLSAEVYAFANVTPDVAVLVKYLDKGDALTTTHDYVFVNKDVENKIESLSAFYEAFNAEFYFSVSPSADILISSLDPGRETNDIYRTDTSVMQGLRDRLLTLDGRALSADERGDYRFSKQMTFDLKLPSAGAYRAYAGVFDNGYLFIHIYSTNHFIFAFDIGEENAEMLISYVEEDAERTRSHYYGTTEEFIIRETTFTGVTVETTFCTNDAETVNECANEFGTETMTSGAYIPE